MKWLNNIIDDRLIPLVHRLLPLEQKCNDVKNKNMLLIEQLNELSVKYDNLNKLFFTRLEATDNNILYFQEELSIIQRKFNLKSDNLNSDLRIHFETAISGLLKTIDNRLNNIGDNRGIVTDLLKKIAKLEGEIDGK